MRRDVWQSISISCSNILIRERIPERVVHAKGAGAFGYFEVKYFILLYFSWGHFFYFFCPGDPWHLQILQSSGLQQGKTQKPPVFKGWAKLIAILLVKITGPVSYAGLQTDFDCRCHHHHNHHHIPNLHHYLNSDNNDQVGKQTPIAVRFSTVGGESGSADTARCRNWSLYHSNHAFGTGTHWHPKQVQTRSSSLSHCWQRERICKESQKTVQKS